MFANRIPMCWCARDVWQGVWVLAVLTPVLLLNVSEHDADWLQPTDIVGANAVLFLSVSGLYL